MDLSEGQADAAATSLVQKFEASGTAELGEIKTLAYGLDVSDESSVAKAMNAVITRWGRIDCLVAAAGARAPLLSRSCPLCYSLGIYATEME